MIINRSSPESKVQVGKEEPLGETEGARVGVHPAAELLEVDLVLTLERKDGGSMFTVQHSTSGPNGFTPQVLHTSRISSHLK